MESTGQHTPGASIQSYSMGQATQLGVAVPQGWNESKGMSAADLLVWPMEERRPTRPWWPEGPLMELPVSVPMLIMA